MTTYNSGVKEVDAAIVAERRVVQLLAAAWNAYTALPVEHPMDQDEFCRGMHSLQEKVLARSARRELNVVDVKEDDRD